MGGTSKSSISNHFDIFNQMFHEVGVVWGTPVVSSSTRSDLFPGTPKHALVLRGSSWPGRQDTDPNSNLAMARLLHVAVVSCLCLSKVVNGFFFTEKKTWKSVWLRDLFAIYMMNVTLWSDDILYQKSYECNIPWVIWSNSDSGDLWSKTDVNHPIKSGSLCQ